MASIRKGEVLWLYAFGMSRVRAAVLPFANLVAKCKPCSDVAFFVGRTKGMSLAPCLGCYIGGGKGLLSKPYRQVC
jgi:hypothetical protein